MYCFSSAIAIEATPVISASSSSSAEENDDDLDLNTAAMTRKSLKVESPADSDDTTGVDKNPSPTESIILQQELGEGGAARKVTKIEISEEKKEAVN